MLDSEAFCGISWKELGLILGGALTLGTFIITYFEFRKNNKVRRADFLDKLAQEFNDPKMYLAKKILDDFWIETQGDPTLSDADLVFRASQEKIEEAKLKTDVKTLLGDHKQMPIIGYGRHKARQSFDDLLDFFTKMQHYLDLNLVKKKELNYFIYYLDRCARKADGAVMQFASIYRYTEVSRLMMNLGVEIPQSKS